MIEELPDAKAFLEKASKVTGIPYEAFFGPGYSSNLEYRLNQYKKAVRAVLMKRGHGITYLGAFFRVHHTTILYSKKTADPALVASLDQLLNKDEDNEADGTRD